MHWKAQGHYLYKLQQRNAQFTLPQTQLTVASGEAIVKEISTLRYDNKIPNLQFQNDRECVS
jgi:hypothetical protein